jgi:hypothetical protein
MNDSGIIDNSFLLTSKLFDKCKLIELLITSDSCHKVRHTMFRFNNLKTTVQQQHGRWGMIRCCNVGNESRFSKE